jgi:L-aminopeptidase/D-esterase-like protein
MTPLPEGFAVGHATDAAGGTGCTVVLAPDGTTASGEVRGGGPGTRETDLLSPAAGPRDVQAVLLAGGSAYGLAAADGVIRWLAERGHGYRTRSGVLVPLVPAAVVFDIPFGDPTARPGPADGYAACEAATPTPARGSVGAGTGCAVGKLLGPDAATKGGVGLAAEDIAGCRVAALAVVNAFGDVLAEDGSVLAGPRRDGAFVRTADLLRAGAWPSATAREATTLVCVMTDAALSKTDAWLVARAASTGIGRTVDPAHTVVDGDATFALASGRVSADPLVLAMLVPHVVAAAIRDAIRAATSLHGCPAVSELHRSAPGQRAR